ncbi:hypothetical protein PSTT_08694 [Puccinia striiformis]|uniref:Putative 5'-nucleotidase C-terminal domain-containing protein n=1 Tax=Puccinia striiformis TaxID=27350 RepID=A0A2S4VBP8_9BASI|nr:hypothetical protein PSTT_08694 [Puccinia striiformis]
MPEPWTKEAIIDKPDLFLLAGHMGVCGPDWKRVLDSIQTIHPEVPVIILGGHYHICDCQQLDDGWMSLASGRYMETLGWMSLSGLDEPEQKPNYLFTGPDGVFETIVKNREHSNPMLGIIHTTAMRADLYKGNFTSNDQYVTMPFDNFFQYVVDVPQKTAEEVLGILDAGGPVRNKAQLRQLRRDLETGEGIPRDQNFHLGHDVNEHYLAWIRLQSGDHHHQQHTLMSEGSDSQTTKTSYEYGYITKDQCPGNGNGAIHTPLPIVDQTEYVATSIPQDSSNLIDAVFNRNYTMEKDVKEYNTAKANEVLGLYAQSKWNN